MSTDSGQSADNPKPDDSLLRDRRVLWLSIQMWTVIGVIAAIVSAIAAVVSLTVAPIVAKPANTAPRGFKSTETY
jgi:hypothetical protein